MSVYGIVGPRDFRGKIYDNYAYIEKCLKSFEDATQFILGGSKGIEELAHQYAVQNNISFQIVRPNIRIHGENSAFDLRNVEILLQAEAMIVFWDGISSKYIDLFRNAAKAGKETCILPIK